MKKCKKCNNWISLDNFSKDSTRTDNLHPYCKNCRSNMDKEYKIKNPHVVEKNKERSKKWRQNNPERSKELVLEWKKRNPNKKSELDRKSQLWTHYRLTIEKWMEMYNSQNGSCAICKKNGNKLYVDHDHKCCPKNITCGKCVRGLVCQKCNIFLHYIDSEYLNYIEIAVEYINKEIYENPL